MKQSTGGGKTLSVQQAAERHFANVPGLRSVKLQGKKILLYFSADAIKSVKLQPHFRKRAVVPVLAAARKESPCEVITNASASVVAVKKKSSLIIPIIGGIIAATLAVLFLTV